MIPIGSKELTTPRLLLRKFRLSDGLELFEAGTLGVSPEDATEFVRKMMEFNDDPQTFSWVIDYQGKAVGRVKAWEINPRDNYVQLGYDIGAAYRNNGLMTEAVKAVCEYLLTEAEVNRVYCMVRESNLASRRVCEKAGFTHEGTLRNHWMEADGTYVNVYVYGLLKEDLTHL